MIPQRTETTFEPSPATIDAIQFIASLEEHRPTTTESRLTLVVQQFERLAEETEADRDVRLADLQRRRERIEAEIRELSEGELLLPSPEASTDRLRDILQIASELSGDFLQYREDLRAVDLHLREQILSPETSRGEILEQLLAGDDLLGQSTVGRTFTAFFRMLNDPAQTRATQEVVDRLLERDFARTLQRSERERAGQRVQRPLRARAGGAGRQDGAVPLARPLRALPGLPPAPRAAARRCRRRRDWPCPRRTRSPRAPRSRWSWTSRACSCRRWRSTG